MQLHQPITQLLQVNHPIKSFHVENPRSFNHIATRTHNKNKKYKSYICLQFSVTPSLELVHPVTSISDPAKTTTGKLTLSPDLIIPAPMEAHGVSFRRVLELAFCVAGIWSAYIYQGVLQETVIMSTKRFGPNKERFEHLAFLNFAQSSVCLIWSFMMIKLWPSKDTGRAPWWSYWSAGITNTIGPAMGIEALKYISYPAQVLAKSSKMIPVMVMGTLVYGIRYTLPEYLCTLLVAGGVSAFALAKSSSKTISKLAHPNAPLGYGLCFLNLAFDGFTNATQDSISARYPKTGAWDIMLGMNLWGAIYNFVFMFGWPQASGYQAIEFCKNHPEAGWDILYYCLCGAIGQNFIFFTISRFGSLTNTTITTTRKFVSIVVSSVVSGNPLSRKQWGSVVMVFSGLSYQIYLKWQKAQKKRKTM
ncbi:putative UAA transporter [Helianthus annuus]|nr:putative UAA transporter [Helianthus annuus]KAJ0432828.1 putative UAA transporter [Helianthus annuus]